LDLEKKLEGRNNDQLSELRRELERLLSERGSKNDANHERVLQLIIDLETRLNGKHSHLLTELQKNIENVIVERSKHFEQVNN